MAPAASGGTPRPSRYMPPRLYCAVHRLYRLEGLQLRMRVRRRKHGCLHRGVVPKATHPHQRLSMDFVHDQLFDARPFRILTVIDALLHNSGRVTDRSQSCLNAIEFALTQACPGLTYDSVPHI